MDIDSLRREKLAEIEQRSRERAVAEIMALKDRYRNAKDLTYAFEHDGREVNAVFVTASLQSPPSPANGYTIDLIAPLPVVANGQAYIVDSKGRRLGVGAVTARRGTENRIQLDALAVE